MKRSGLIPKKYAPMVRFYDHMQDQIKIYLSKHPETTRKDLLGMISLLKMTHDPVERERINGR